MHHGRALPGPDTAPWLWANERESNVVGNAAIEAAVHGRLSAKPQAEGLDPEPRKRTLTDSCVERGWEGGPRLRRRLQPPIYYL